MISTALIEHYLSHWPKHDVVDIALKNRRYTAELLIGNMPAELNAQLLAASESRDMELKGSMIAILDRCINVGGWVYEI